MRKIIILAVSVALVACGEVSEKQTQNSPFSCKLR